jgi:Zn-dependent protease with chaperone function
MTRRTLTAVVLLLAALVSPASGQDGQPHSRYDIDVLPEGEPVEIDAYAEFRQGGIFISDGQRVKIWFETEIGGEVANPAEVELGYEFRAEGMRMPDGVILASRIEAKPNGVSMFENGAIAAGNELEREWLQEGRMFTDEMIVGPIIAWDDRVRRVNRILEELLPPYLEPGDARIHVVETEQWNAVAMANGAIWIYSGLIDDFSDDELAIVIGHELAHFTHEHSRRGMKSNAITQALASLGAGALVGALGGGAVGEVASLATLVGTTALVSGYSRELEDQADRVGLRYAYEAGYDPHAGLEVWNRFYERYGQNDQVTNFVMGTHSRPSERIENIRGEIVLNYRIELE